MIKSIKFRLFLCLILVFSTISAGFNFYLYTKQKKAAFSAIDSFLISKAHVFSGLIEVYDDGSIEFEATEKKAGFDRAQTLYDVPLSGHYFQVYFTDGRLLSSSPSLAGSDLPLSFERIAEEGDYFDIARGPDNEPLRVFSQRVSLTIRNRDYSFIIQAAENLEDVYLFLDSLRRQMMYSIPVTLLASGIGGLIIVWFSLIPLKRFSREVGSITEKNLDKRLDREKLDLELQDLAGSFNTTLDNIERAFNQQKRFISDASHELRTPTSVIKSCCEIHLKKERETEDYKKALDIIKNSADRMESLIGRLLKLSRIEQRMYIFKKEDLSIGDTIKKSVHLLQPLAEKKDVYIDASSLRDDIHIRGDRDSIAEVFINLIDNAIKYNRNGGMITITADGDDSRSVRVDISDTGIGIPDNELSSIFQSFYRIDPSRTNNAAKGAGLGLNIARAIVENHGGRIDVTSRPGEGSVFSVHLPRGA